MAGASISDEQLAERVVRGYMHYPDDVQWEKKFKKNCEFMLGLASAGIATGREAERQAIKLRLQNMFTEIDRLAGREGDDGT